MRSNVVKHLRRLDSSPGAADARIRSNAGTLLKHLIETGVRGEQQRLWSMRRNNSLQAHSGGLTRLVHAGEQRVNNVRAKVLHLTGIDDTKALACDHPRLIFGPHVFCECGKCIEGAGRTGGYPQPIKRRATGDHVKHAFPQKSSGRMHAYGPASVHLSLSRDSPLARPRCQWQIKYSKRDGPDETNEPRRTLTMRSRPRLLNHQLIAFK